MKPIENDGMVFDRAKILDLHKNMITLRNVALEGNHFGWAVALSHVLIVLAHVAEEMEDAQS